MLKLLCYTVVLFVYSTINAQITYEPAYFIDNNGNRIDCLIRNLDWKNNPTGFSYKISEDGEVIQASIDLIREFRVKGYAKFQRFEVEIDRSSNSLSDLTNFRQARFNSETLFLKVLVKGDATLYYYEDNNLRRFFYQLKNDNVEQLIYKRYNKQPSEIGENMRFRQQLWNKLKCEGIEQQRVDRIRYNESDLTKFFKTYNICINPEISYSEAEKGKFQLNLFIRPGLNFSNLVIDNNVSGIRDTDFGQNLGYRIGLEVEASLPFNKNKWAVFFEPTFQSYSKESATRSINFLPANTAKVKYTSIEIPMGIRHYLYLNGKSKLFLNGALVYDLPLSSNIEFEIGAEEEINSIANWAFGAGFVYNNKFSFEFRYQTNREVLEDSPFWESEYSGYSFILGYKIF